MRRIIKPVPLVVQRGECEFPEEVPQVHILGPSDRDVLLNTEMVLCIDDGDRCFIANIAEVIPEIETRIDDAIHTILNCWDEWDAFSQQEAQQAQDPDEWFRSMQDQLTAVLLGMVIDPPVDSLVNEE